MKWFRGYIIKNSISLNNNNQIIIDAICNKSKNQNTNSLSYKETKERKKLLNKVEKLPILDVGTGNGWCAIVAAKYYGYNVISIDINKKYIHLARTNAKAYGVEKLVTFKKMDATRIPYSNEFFGTVISYQTLHHTRYPFRVIEEMFRVCKRNGRVLISELNNEGFKLYHGEYYEYPDKYYKFLSKKILNINNLWKLLDNISSEVSIKESKYTNLINCIK